MLTKTLLQAKWRVARKVTRVFKQVDKLLYEGQIGGVSLDGTLMASKRIAARGAQTNELMKHAKDAQAGTKVYNSLIELAQRIEAYSRALIQLADKHGFPMQSFPM